MTPPEYEKFHFGTLIDAPARFRRWWNGSKRWYCGTLTYTPRTLALLFFWLLWGDVCYQLMEWVTPNIMPLRLKDLGAPNWVLGVMMSSLAGSITFFVNPVISFKSDRHRSRWGRRIPFIFFSAPVLVGCLVLLAFGDRIGFWMHDHLPLKQFAAKTVAVAVLGIALAAFTFFNTFVTSVFWYLFNDVVPEHLLAKFMSWFRLVSTGSVAFCQMFVYGHVQTHYVEVFLAAGLLYFVGFGLMCLNVKEGEYPPPPENIDRKVGPLASLKTYGKECFSLWHYRYQFIATFSGSIAAGIGTFGVFMSQAIGLNLDQIGKIGACSNIAVSILIVGSGWLADRYHPIRVCMAGVFLQVFVTIPLGFIWFFWHPEPNAVFWFSITVSVLLTAPMVALTGVWDPPLFMRYFPRDRYGQFCSANAMCRAAGWIVGGALAGTYLDVVGRYSTHFSPYYFIPFWNLFFNLPSVFMIVKMYKSWKQYGGDESYIPPLPAGDAADAMAGPAWEAESGD